MSDINTSNMSLGPGVIETIISIAANEVEGVASVGSYTANGIRSMLKAAPSTSGIEVSLDDDDRVRVDIHVDVYNGYILPDLAANLRQAISDAVLVQIGLEVSAVDIYVDGIQFANN